MFSKEEIKLVKPCYEAIKKISKGKWEWKPEVGEWCMEDENMYLIKGFYDFFKEGIGLCNIDTGEIFYTEKIEKYTPFLHWEKLEGILEGMGYIISFFNNPEVAWACQVWKDDKQVLVVDACKTRQEAVMRAVIEVVKCLKG
ncbi:MAG: hypothetical protein HWN68_13960 [Desulfobacterales bacterium]|nr:hypothetical protein [Desulfobacterales bacterium]